MCKNENNCETLEQDPLDEDSVLKINHDKKTASLGRIKVQKKKWGIIFKELKKDINIGLLLSWSQAAYHMRKIFFHFNGTSILVAKKNQTMFFRRKRRRKYTARNNQQLDDSSFGV